ncbi:MAG: hypothetical protein Q7S22_08115 [Candidatus Micrarchaeota archaeon]|nr:hypothetical protein [Candidatus Micrarchaeota archaeon]
MNLILLTALTTNLLILVAPFFSFAPSIFFLIIYALEKPKYSKKQKLAIGAGLLISFIGIFIVSVGQIGMENFLKDFTLDNGYLLSGLTLTVGSALWTYFLYRSAVKEKTDPFSYTISYSSAAFVVGLMAMAIMKPDLLGVMGNMDLLGYIYPLLGATALATGVMLSFIAFQKTTTKTKIQDTMIAVMANSEIVPLLFISYVILAEWNIEGFLGSLVVLAGLAILYYSEVINN